MPYRGPVQSQDLSAAAFVRFTLQGYSTVLGCLQYEGYALHPASDIAFVDGRAVFLRHDVDLHLEGALEMAAVEEKAGVRSTWYVGTRLAYNPAYEPNAAVIRELVERGHTIGLHYTAGLPYIGADRSTLGNVAGCCISSHVMHEPSAGGRDYHAKSPWNPHSYGLHYVSDSRMKWTEPYLSALLNGEPERAMLNTHHEHWTGQGMPWRHERACEIRNRLLRQHLDYADHLLGGYQAERPGTP